MGFAAFCLLPLLIPQAPTPAPQPAPLPTAQQPAGDDADAAALATAERAGAEADVAALQRLAIESAPDIAARAAFLLAKEKDERHLAACAEIVATSRCADARSQAMQALFRNGDAKNTPTAAKALADADRVVRTLAAQALGKWRRPAGVEPLLGMIDDHRNDDGTAPTDVQAALLALHDLGAADHLLRITTSIKDGKVQNTGEALTFLLQDLAPSLAPDKELTLLLAILDHREPLVRRFAITRLARTDEPGAVKALEGRLAHEGNELRPLIEVALSQLRRDAAPPPDEIGRLKQNWHALSQRAETAWAGMSTARRAVVIAIPAVLVLGMFLLIRAHRRRQRDDDAEAMAELVQPSDEYLEELAATDAVDEAAPEAEPATTTAAAERSTRQDEEPVAVGDESAWEHDVSGHR